MAAHSYKSKGTLCKAAVRNIKFNPIFIHTVTRVTALRAYLGSVSQPMWVPRILFKIPRLLWKINIKTTEAAAAEIAMGRAKMVRNRFFPLMSSLLMIARINPMTIEQTTVITAYRKETRRLFWKAWEVKMVR